MKGIGAQLLVRRDRHVLRPAQVAVGRAGDRRVPVAGRDQDRPPGIGQGLDHESRRLARDVVVFKKVATAGDQVAVLLARSVDYAAQRCP